MTTTMKTVPTRLEDALYALSVGGRVPNATILDGLVRHYPEYASELTEAAISIVLDVLSEDGTEDFDADQNETSPAVARAMSHFHNRIYEVERAATPRPVTPAVAEAREVPNPFATGSKEEARALAIKLGANTTFLIKLRDRLIEPSSITAGFLKFAAGEIGSKIEFLASHFAGPPSVALGAEYKAERKPEARRRQNFEDAIRTSGLTDAQVEKLLKL